MVDVKKVTATIKKPILYASATASVTNEDINFNPLNNPTFPESSTTVYTIDPFAVFQQEGSKLKVKIPFTRFYRFKCAIGVTNASPAALPDNNLDQFSIAKPILVCSESLVLERESYSGITQIQTNVYNQDGSGLIVYDPVMSGGNVTGYDIRKTLTPAIVEGIVELYAGDILTFKHTRTMLKKSQVTGIASIAAPFGTKPGGLDVGDFYGPVDGFDPYSHYTYARLNLGTFPFVSVDSTAYIASASFFFELSEITDL